MQNFNQKQHKKFRKLFKIKDNPWKWDKIYLEKTYKYIKYISWIPWLKMVWIWNSIAMNCSTKESDIDLLIVTDNNRLWLVRILITLIFQILWVRKNDKYHAWRFCLSFLTTIDWLNFKSWKIKNDIYLYFWIIYFKPILDYDNTYKKFIKQNPTWADFSEYKDLLKENKKYIKYKK